MNKVSRWNLQHGSEENRSVKSFNYEAENPFDEYILQAKRTADPATEAGIKRQIKKDLTNVIEEAIREIQKDF